MRLGQIAISKGCESARLVRQKANRGSKKERNKIKKGRGKVEQNCTFPVSGREEKKKGPGHGVTRGRDGNPNFTSSE